MKNMFHSAQRLLRWQFLSLAIGLMPFQASLAVTSSSVSAASTAKAKAKPAPAKPAAVIVTKAAPAKSPSPKATAKPVAVSSFKPAAKTNANGASQKSAPTANPVPSTAVSQNKTAEP